VRLIICFEWFFILFSTNQALQGFETLEGLYIPVIFGGSL
jgi:hypothetical protein